ncbi:High-affinity zinc uptake system protein ZnuA [Geodia barretti]|uniref:High-affinity zinc uptake system protein ZnuA n=1 Tax=Geodia barretti TaxID=519541 RepID=A0AA35QS67_GEOBA|nr:High-affinity zinc uptake system protein ZnuA [Geodia barretti]
MRGAESPHTYRMRPSDAGVIGKARVIFMIGDLVETSLAGAIHKLGGKARVVELAEVPGLVRKPLRMGGAFEDDGHDHGHGHGHSHGPGKGHSHDDEAFDMHVWLDPVNAGLMAVAIARTLSEADPANAAKYEANAGALVARLDELKRATRRGAGPGERQALYRVSRFLSLLRGSFRADSRGLGGGQHRPVARRPSRQRASQKEGEGF